MALFFIFSMMLGAALQLTNMYGDTFLDGFEKVPEYKDSFVVKYSTDHIVDLTDVRNIIYSYHSIFSEKIWY